MPKIKVLFSEFKEFEISDNPTADEMDRLADKMFEDVDVLENGLLSNEIYGKGPILDAFMVIAPTDIMEKIQTLPNFYPKKGYHRQPKSSEIGCYNNMRFFKDHKLV